MSASSIEPKTDHGRRAPTLSVSERRCLLAVFHHPTAHNLEWRDVVGLIERLGGVGHRPNGEVELRLGEATHVMRRPHGKDLSATEVADIRHFMTGAGFTAGSAYVPSELQETQGPDLLVAIDHREARIYHIDVEAQDETAQVIRPYDPHHVLHHLSHKDHSHEQGQRAPEDATFYERIAQAVRGGNRIILIGHGTGKSNAADHLAEYLRTHHTDLYRRMARDTVADLSCATPPQLLAIARGVLR